MKLDVMLNKTKFELELIFYADMYLLFEIGIRGRVSYWRNKKATSCIRIQLITMAKPYVEFNAQELIEAKKKLVTKMKKCCAN